MDAVRARWTLQGANIVVTGGTKGIGYACCQELVALGANMLLCSRQQVRNAVEDTLPVDYPATPPCCATEER